MIVTVRSPDRGVEEECGPPRREEEFLWLVEHWRNRVNWDCAQGILFALTSILSLYHDYHEVEDRGADGEDSEIVVPPQCTLSEAVPKTNQCEAYGNGSHQTDGDYFESERVSGH